jgi:hypothetical protein
MNKIILVLVFLGSLFCIWAQEPVSMRNVALGGVIDGDWENIYDPIELSFYPQQYFFTNLSDIKKQVSVYDDEVVFEQKSEFVSEYPFGFTFKTPFSEVAKHALLLRFKDNQKPAANSGIGETEAEEINYIDADHDYLYDSKGTYYSKDTNYKDVSSRLLLLLNNSFPMGDNIFGVRLSLDKHTDLFDEASMNFGDYDFSEFLDGYYEGDHTNYKTTTIEDLIQHRTTLEHGESGTFETSNKSSVAQALLSLMHPSDLFGGNSELRYDLNLSLNDADASKTNDRYDGHFYQVTGDSAYAEGFYKQKATRTYSKPRNEIFANTKIRHNQTTGIPRLQQNFWEINLGAGYFYGDYKNSINNSIESRKLYADSTSTGFDQLTTYTESEKSTDNGDYKGFHAKVAARSSVFFSDYVCFGYGFVCDFQTFDRKTDRTYDFHSLLLNQEGDAFDTSDDNRITTDQVDTGKFEETRTTLQTILPVGLEFSIPRSSLTDNDGFGLRNFSFRLGTVFTHTTTFSDVRATENAVIANTSVEENGAGDVDVTLPTSDWIYGVKTITKERTGTKKFTAGIGYNHSDNLSIDLASTMDSNGDNFFIGLMFTVKR